MIPNIVKSKEEEAMAYGQGYGADPFSSHLWLKEWRKFSDLISALVTDKSIGSCVVTTDIANFYDSIEIPRLISKIRRSAPAESDTTDALNAFLSSWNRRHIGYLASTKGIPQEIISDASRVLSHFYLQEFDGDFKEYCDHRKLRYIRWSDDILIFGNSRQKLQAAVHHASRLLRDLGLNLNASKTKYMSKNELSRQRCLNLIAAISDDDHKKVSAELKKVKLLLSKGIEVRIDTVFRAMIGHLSRNKSAQTTLNVAFLMETASDQPDLLHGLNNLQMLRYIQIMEKPFDTFVSLRRAICRAEFGGPKASFLHIMRKYRNQLATIGLTKKKALSTISSIEKSSSDSDVILKFCIPVVRNQYGL